MCFPQRLHRSACPLLLSGHLLCTPPPPRGGTLQECACLATSFGQRLCDSRVIPPPPRRAPKLSSPSHAWPRDPASSSSTCQDRGTPRSPPAPGGLSSAFGGLSLARTPPSRASSTVAHSRHVSLLTDPSEAWVDGPSPPLSSDGELSAAEADKAPACPELPDECWLLIMEHVGVRELCALARTCQELRRLSADR